MRLLSFKSVINSEAFSVVRLLQYTIYSVFINQSIKKDHILIEFATNIDLWENQNRISSTIRLVLFG